MTFLNTTMLIFTKQTFKNNVFKIFLFTTTIIITMFFGVNSASAEILNVETGYPEKITPKETVLSGYVSNDTIYPTWVWFEYGRNGKFEKTTQKIPVVRNKIFKGPIFNLEEGETYIYKAVARRDNDGKTVYGDIKYFTVEDISTNNNSFFQNTTTYNNSTTYNNNVDYSNNINSQNNNSNVQHNGKTIVPVTSIGGKTVVTTNTAVLKGVVLTGGSPSEGWFEWGYTKSVENETPHQKLPISNGQIIITETLGNLSPNTTYYYRTVAKTSAGVSKGIITSFKTSNTGLFGGLFNSVKDTQTKESQNVVLGSLKINKNETENTPFINTKDNFKNENKISAFGWSQVLKEQFFSIDQTGKIVYSGESFSTSKNKNLANVFALGIVSFDNILPETFIGWLTWIIIIFILVTQLRRILLDKRKREDEQKQREEEVKELRRYQELSLSTKGKKQPA